MKIYPNGATAHSGGNRAPDFHFRKEVKGWSYTTALRQRKFLWSVQPEGLHGTGYAMTLTVGDLPANAAVWNRMRKQWWQRAQRLGADRLHWVTELQERGVPHLHCAVYYPGDHSPGVAWLLATAWVQVCEANGVGASLAGQDGKSIDGPLGWLKYMAKHASRGAAHVQRQGMPPGWVSSGRMWGHSGAWPTVEPVEVMIRPLEFYRLRRLMRAWSIADARSRNDRKRVRYLRRAPSIVSDPNRSRFQAVSEWVPEHVSLRLMDLLDRESGS